MRRIIIIGSVIAIALVAATGGVAAQRYLITSPDQIKPGAVGYGNLSARTKRLIRNGGRGPRGRRGPRGTAGPAGNALAQASGLVAWTSDPALISKGIGDTSGSIHGGSIWLSRGDRISWLAELITAHGAKMTHGSYAVYNSSFRLVARTADKPSAFAAAPADSWVKLALTAPFTAPASGRYYLVDLLAGATVPKVGIVASEAAVLSGANVLPSGVPRGIGGGAGFSAFPSILKNKGSGLTRCMVAG